MALSKIWVLAEATDGKVTTTTLEMLTKARELADTVEAVYAGGDADAVAGRSARTAPPRCSPPATSAAPSPACRWPLPSPPRSRVATPPTPSCAATSYDGRDIAGRLSVKLDRTVLTNNVDLEVDGDSLVTTEPVFGGTTNVKTTFTAGGPHIVLIRPKSFAAEPAGGGRCRRGRRRRRARARRHGGARRSPTATSRSARARSSTRPPSWCPAVVASASPTSTRWSRSWPSCSRGRRARPVPSSTPAGCPTATRWARPARS